MNLEAVHGLDKKNKKLDTVPPTEKHQQDFMKIDPNGNALSNFFENYMRQAQNPHRFIFFKVPNTMAMICKVRDSLKNLGSKAKELKDKAQKFLKQYRIEPPRIVKKEENKAAMGQNNNKITKKDTAMNEENPTQVAPEQLQQPAQAQQPVQGAQNPEYPQYKADDLNWDTLNNLGITQESLQKRGLLDQLLKGFKINELVPVSFNLNGAATTFDARLSVRKAEDGTPTVLIHGVKKEPSLHLPFFGHQFSEEDKKNLLTTGNMGRVVELTNPKTGEKIPSLISLDRLTNEIVALRTEKIKIPDDFRGKKLSEEQKQALQEGKPVYIEGFTSKKGEPFNANIQFNAEKRYIEYVFERPQQGQSQRQPLTEAPREIRGVKLTEEQYKNLSEGKAIRLEGLISQSGTPYSPYFKYDANKGTLTSSLKNPDKVDIKSQIQSRQVSQPQQATSTQTQTTPAQGQVQQKQATQTTKKLIKPKAPKQSMTKPKGMKM